MNVTVPWEQGGYWSFVPERRWLGAFPRRDADGLPACAWFLGSLILFDLLTNQKAAPEEDEHNEEVRALRWCMDPWGTPTALARVAVAVQRRTNLLLLQLLGEGGETPKHAGENR